MNLSAESFSLMTRLAVVVPEPSVSHQISFEPRRPSARKAVAPTTHVRVIGRIAITFAIEP